MTTNQQESPATVPLGCFSNMTKMAIETFTGRVFPIVDIEPDQIDLEDIGHALAHVCRYAGHSRKFYSVAEHCVHVHDYLKVVTRLRAQDYLAALLHDASEAYVGDVTRPLKYHLPEYRAIEARLQEAIYDHFDVTPTLAVADIIKAADSTILKAEAKVLMVSKGATWNFEGLPDVAVEIAGWAPDWAKYQFIKRARALVRDIESGK